MYYVKKIFNKNLIIDVKEIRNKINYLFIPYVSLIGKKEIQDCFKHSNLKIIYLRKRLKSDINSPPHLELKAVKE